MKIDIDGCLQYLCSYGDLQRGETFVIGGDVCVKTDTGCFDLTNLIPRAIAQNQVIHKIELQVVHYEGVEA